MILNVYKELNWTSHDVVARLRGVLKTKKVGHAGTLDPLAEGVLIVLTEADTKKQEEFMKMQKEYVAEVVFGVSSPTYDMEGPLTFYEGSIDFQKIEKTLEVALPSFIGTIKQKVPFYSAVKVGGKKLYKQARAKAEVAPELPEKEVEVYSIEILSFEEVLVDNHKLPIAKVKINCGKGFYVRSLAHDIGEFTKTGATLYSLIRTRIGDYTLENSKKISEVEESFH